MSRKNINANVYQYQWPYHYKLLSPV